MYSDCIPLVQPRYSTIQLYRKILHMASTFQQRQFKSSLLVLQPYSKPNFHAFNLRGRSTKQNVENDHLMSQRRKRMLQKTAHPTLMPKESNTTSCSLPYATCVINSSRWQSDLSWETNQWLHTKPMSTLWLNMIWLLSVCIILSR